MAQPTIYDLANLDMMRNALSPLVNLSAAQAATAKAEYARQVEERFLLDKQRRDLAAKAYEGLEERKAKAFEGVEGRKSTQGIAKDDREALNARDRANRVQRTLDAEKEREAADIRAGLERVFKGGENAKDRAAIEKNLGAQLTSREKEGAADRAARQKLEETIAKIQDDRIDARERAKLVNEMAISTGISPMPGEETAIYLARSIGELRTRASTQYAKDRGRVQTLSEQYNSAIKAMADERASRLTTAARKQAAANLNIQPGELNTATNPEHALKLEQALTELGATIESDQGLVGIVSNLKLQVEAAINEQSETKKWQVKLGADDEDLVRQDAFTAPVGGAGPAGPGAGLGARPGARPAPADPLALPTSRRRAEAEGALLGPVAEATGPAAAAPPILGALAPSFGARRAADPFYGTPAPPLTSVTDLAAPSGRAATSEEEFLRQIAGLPPEQRRAAENEFYGEIANIMGLNVPDINEPLGGPGFETQGPRPLGTGLGIMGRELVQRPFSALDIGPSVTDPMERSAWKAPWGVAKTLIRDNPDVREAYFSLPDDLRALAMQRGLARVRPDLAQQVTYANPFEDPNVAAMTAFEKPAVPGRMGLPPMAMPPQSSSAMFMRPLSNPQEMQPAQPMMRRVPAPPPFNSLVPPPQPPFFVSPPPASSPLPGYQAMAQPQPVPTPAYMQTPSYMQQQPYQAYFQAPSWMQGPQLQSQPDILPPTVDPMSLFSVPRSMSQLAPQPVPMSMFSVPRSVSRLAPQFQQPPAPTPATYLPPQMYMPLPY